MTVRVTYGSSLSSVNRPWSPADIPGCTLAMDPSLGKTLSGSNVTTWKDVLSGSELSFTGQGGALPQFNSSGDLGNSQDYIRTHKAAVAYAMSVDVGHEELYSNTTGLTAIGVINNHNAAGSSPHIVSKYNSTTGNREFAVGSEMNCQENLNPYTSGNTTTLGVVAGKYLQIGTWNPSVLTRVTRRIDSGAKASNDAATPAATMHDGTMTLDLFRITSGNPSDCSYGVIYLYDRVLTSSEIEVVRQFVAKKYAWTLTV